MSLSRHRLAKQRSLTVGHTSACAGIINPTTSYVALISSSIAPQPRVGTVECAVFSTPVCKASITMVSTCIVTWLNTGFDQISNALQHTDQASVQLEREGMETWLLAQDSVLHGEPLQKDGSILGFPIVPITTVTQHGILYGQVQDEVHLSRVIPEIRFHQQESVASGSTILTQRHLD